jgi:hypothetical protein
MRKVRIKVGSTPIFIPVSISTIRIPTITWPAEPPMSAVKNATSTKKSANWSHPGESIS